MSRSRWVLLSCRGIVPLNKQHMGIRLISVPREVSAVKGDETPLFSVEAVEWAMARVMETTLQ